MPLTDRVLMGPGPCNPYPEAVDAARCGAEVTTVEAPWGQPIDPEQLLAAHPSPRVIAVVHAETSTGARSDIAPLGEGKGDALLLVDCVTSVGGIEVDVDGWAVDVAYAGTRRGWGGAPGRARLTVGEGAGERLVERSPSWYIARGMTGGYPAPAT